MSRTWSASVASELDVAGAREDGLLTDRAGRPLRVEVFDGATHDRQTVPAQLDKVKARFGLGALVMVADRGTVTRANLEAIRRADGLERITALNAPQGKRRARTGAVQPSLFDEHNLAEITSEQFPGERPVICRNPLVAAERARKREALLAATETDLEPIARVERGTLADAARIGVAVGEVIKRHPCQTALRLGVLRRTPRLQRKTDQIAQEAALDGIYVLRTTVTPQRLDAPDVVRAYKQLKRGRTPTSQTSRTPLNLSNRAESTTDCTRNFGPCGRRRASARPRRGPASDQRRPASRRGALSGKR